MKQKEYKNIVQNWKSFYTSSGVEKEYADIYIQYVEKLLKNDLPPIFDFNHLSKLLGIYYADLAAMINCPEKYYRSFEIPKRSGGVREITAPYPSLKYVQTWIYKNILSNVKVHGCAHGFVNKRSTLTNVHVHKNQRCLLKIDLKDFFPSIPLSWVIQMFKSFGYEQSVSYYLASLCCHDGVLPQGSPASPTISNIIARHLDRRLYRLAKKFSLNYTRYADDIAFSGEDINAKHIEYVSAIIQECGFIVNQKKVRLYKEYGNKILTGISLASGEPKLPRDYRRSLEKELYYIEKFGLSGHMAHNKIRKANYLESIIGKVEYWLMIEPENPYALKMQKFLWSEYRKRQA